MPHGLNLAIKSCEEIDRAFIGYLLVAARMQRIGIFFQVDKKTHCCLESSREIKKIFP